MADNWASWYQGGMTPPLALPGGGYVPAPLSTPQMSVEDMYQGIYAPPAVPQSLQTRQVQTVNIDPRTGFPTRAPSPSMSAQASFGGSGATAGGRLPMSGMSASGGASSALGAIGRATGNIGASGVRDLGAPQYGTPGQGGGVLGTDGLPANAYTAKTFTERLTPPFSMAAGARGRLGASAAGSGSLTIKAPKAKIKQGDDDIPNLDSLGLGEQGYQRMADSRRGPIMANGKIYYPGGRPPASGGGPPKQQPQRGGGLVALLSGLMGGGQSGGGGGGLGAMLGGGGPSSFGSSPSQGLAMTVNPGTSVGQTLSGMGFSDGAAVPAATIRNLEQRGYF